MLYLVVCCTLESVQVGGFPLFALSASSECRLNVCRSIAGVTLACVYFFWEEELMSLFTHDPHTKEQLRNVWPFLVAVQPLNSIVSVFFLFCFFFLLSSFLTMKHLKEEPHLVPSL